MRGALQPIQISLPNFIAITAQKTDAVWQGGDAVLAFSKIGIFTREIDQAYKLTIVIWEALERVDYGAF